MKSPPPAKAPKMAKQLTAEASEDRVKMFCVAESSVIQVAWYFAGKRLTESSRYEFRSSADGTCILYVKDLSSSDQGEYTCEVTTEAGVSKTSFSFVGSVFQSIHSKVTAYVEQQQLAIRGSMQAQEMQMSSQSSSMASMMKESKTMVMEQSMMGHSESFSSSQMASSMASSMQMASSMASSMHETSFSSSSLAEMKFETMSMSSMSSLTSETYAMSSSTEMSGLLEGMRSIKHSQGSPPRIEALPEDISIETGKVLTVACAFSGEPVPDIQWSRSGKVLPGDQASGRFHIETLEDLTTLIITDVREDDAGAYTLKLLNEFGSDTATVHISIRS